MTSSIFTVSPQPVAYNTLSKDFFIPIRNFFDLTRSVVILCQMIIMVHPATMAPIAERGVRFSKVRKL